MKLITRDSDYAIRALSYIARRKDKVVSVKELAKRLRIPKPFLRKILQKLNKKALLKSYKGIGGGFMLLCSPHKILITEVMKIFQGPIKFNEHLFKKSACPHIKTCILKKKLDIIEENAVSELKSITIASLICKEDQ